MATLSANVARQLRAVRNILGTDVLFGGVTYRVVTEEVAGAKAGINALPQSVLGPFIASADPRVFVFSAQDFKPYTTVTPPQEGDYLTWHNLLYLVVHATYEDVGSGSTQVLIYAYRKIL
jgi:hypothetical protein